VSIEYINIYRDLREMPFVQEYQLLMRQNVRNRLGDFENSGFAIVPNVIDRGVISALVAAIEETQENTAARNKGVDQYAIRNLLAVPAIKTLAESVSLRMVAENVIGGGAFAVRGLLFDKTLSANWKVAWHQDLTIAVRQRREVSGYGPWSVKAGVQHVQPPVSVLEEMVTLRLHLDDCGETNGPLQVMPGSHRAGKLSAEDIQSWRAKVPAVNCTVKCGGVLLMRPLLLHASSAARQPGHRRVIHLEFAVHPLGGGLQWSC
jgi:hypothetical protein